MISINKKSPSIGYDTRTITRGSTYSSKTEKVCFPLHEITVQPPPFQQRS